MNWTSKTGFFGVFQVSAVNGPKIISHELFSYSRVTPTQLTTFPFYSCADGRPTAIEFTNPYGPILNTLFRQIQHAIHSILASISEMEQSRFRTPAPCICNSMVFM